MAVRSPWQASPGATTYTDLATVTAGKSLTASTLTICNQNSTAVTYRVAFCIAGATNTAPAAAQFIVKDAALPANSTDTLTIGMTGAAGDKVVVYASAAGVSFNLFGDES